jgi:dienelactone hydrolase
MDLIVGMCLGGHLAFRAAFDPRVMAAVCFFGTDIHSETLGKGKNSDSLKRASEIKGELIMIFGKKVFPFESEINYRILMSLLKAEISLGRLCMTLELYSLFMNLRGHNMRLSGMSFQRDDMILRSQGSVGICC